jgi:capsular polysaccharide biosynthesis protein
MCLQFSFLLAVFLSFHHVLGRWGTLQFDTFESIAPAIYSGGSVQFSNKSTLYCWVTDAIGNIHPNISYDYRDLLFPHHVKLRPQVPKKEVVIQNDVIYFTSHSGHYFHFTLETFPQILSLDAHSIFKRYPNASLLVAYDQFDATKNPPIRNVLDFFNLSHVYKRKHIISGQISTKYVVAPGYSLIAAQKVGHFTNQYPYILTDVLRSYHEQLRPKNPHRHIYITRKHDRRAMDNDLELYAALVGLVPKLEVYYPTEDVAKQFEVFSSSSLIIAPHGNALTNLIFAPPTVMLIELCGKLNANFISLHMQIGGRSDNYLGFRDIPHSDPLDPSSNIIVNIPDVIPRVEAFLKGRLV